MKYLLIFYNARFTPSNIESCVKDKSFSDDSPVSNSSTSFWYTSKSSSKSKIILENSKIFGFNSILACFWKSSTKLFASSLSAISRSENSWAYSKAFNSPPTNFRIVSRQNLLDPQKTWSVKTWYKGKFFFRFPWIKPLNYL